MPDQKSETSQPLISDSQFTSEDARLVLRCRKGEQAAWDELVERYQRLIFAIPRRAGLSEDEATDVFQEVFVTLVQKLDELEQPDRLRSWLVTTAKFKTWAVVRGRKPEAEAGEGEEHSEMMAAIADDSPAADEMLIELEQQHLIRTAVTKLDERCRTIVSMIYLRSTAASYAEVAGEIGVGETSISPLRARCLKKLEKLLR
ncbi:MAG: sigma-70 family RNA polymerase sigma factor [Acidobacteria bacterium]|nr:sigma-70 family RNA polymerase sigma factor [Acidobacteriota bacterium]